MAFGVRAVACAAAPGAPQAAAGPVVAMAAAGPGRREIAGYLPIRSEFDPLPAMRALSERGLGVSVPVIAGPGRPLTFRRWTPGVALEAGAFGVPVPVAGEAVVPDMLLVPMLAFDARGHRLGYGGGFYDRTIAALRADGGVLAVGLAFVAQEVAAVPDAETDMRLDALVTEAGIRNFD